MATDGGESQKIDESRPLTDLSTLELVQVLRERLAEASAKPSWMTTRGLNIDRLHSQTLSAKSLLVDATCKTRDLFRYVSELQEMGLE